MILYLATDWALSLLWASFQYSKTHILNQFDDYLLQNLVTLFEMERIMSLARMFRSFTTLAIIFERTQIKIYSNDFLKRRSRFKNKYHFVSMFYNTANVKRKPSTAVKPVSS